MRPAYVSAEDVMAARRGDRAALARVVSSSESLCCWMARRWTSRLPSTMSRADAVQDCRIALLDAVRMWDPRKGAWTTYAVQWMKARLRRSVAIERAGASPARWTQSGTLDIAPTKSIDHAPDERAAVLELVDEAQTPEETVELRQRVRLLESVVDSIEGERARGVLRGRLHGRRFEDIAVELGISAAGARKIDAKYRGTFVARARAQMEVA